MEKLKVLDNTINLKLSLQLRKEYKHKSGDCYQNAYELYSNDEVDAIVIGYYKEKEGAFKESVIRHAFCIKDGQIIDTSIPSTQGVYASYYIFNNNKQDKALYYSLIIKCGNYYSLCVDGFLPLEGFETGRYAEKQLREII